MRKKLLFLTLLLLAVLSVSLFAAKEAKLNIPSPNYEIPAIITTPDAVGNYPGIVMVHGFGSEKNEVGNFYKRLATKLADNGIASIRFDFPGSGDHALGFEHTDINRMIRERGQPPRKMFSVSTAIGGFIIEFAAFDIRLSSLFSFIMRFVKPSTSFVGVIPTKIVPPRYY